MFPVQTKDGGSVGFRGPVVSLGDGVGVPQRMLYEHAGDERTPGIKIDIEVSDGAPWVTHLALTGAPGPRRVKSSTVEATADQLEQMVEDILEAAAFVANDKGAGWVRKQSGRPDNVERRRRQSVPAIRRSRKRQRRNITDDHLQKVAEIYKNTPASSRTAAVAGAFGKTPRTAGRYIQLARQAGLLQSTTKGKATDG